MNHLESEKNDNHLGRFSLVDVCLIVRNHWKAGGLAAVLVVALFVTFLMSREDMYEAQASLTVELDTENIIQVGEVVDFKVNNVNLLNTVMNTHVERIKSRPVAEAVAAKMPEDIYVNFVEAYVGPLSERPSDAPPPNAASFLVKRAIEVERGLEDDSQIIVITVLHANPVVAQWIANTYAKEYIIYKANVRSDSTNEAVQFLKAQVDRLRGELEATENELQSFRQKHNLVSIQDEGNSVSAGLLQFSEARTAAKIRLLEVESRLEALSAAEGDVSKIMEIPFVGMREDVGEIYAQLTELQRERQVLDETYLSKHPKVLENEASTRSVKLALDRLIDQAAKQVSNERALILSELASLGRSMDQSEQDVLDGEKALLEYRRMEREAEKQREIFDMLSTRYGETRLAQQVTLTSIKTLEEAELPRFPNRPSTIQVAAASLLLGGFFFCFVPLGLEIVDTRLRSFNDVEGGLGQTILGDVRYYPKKSYQDLTQAVLKRDVDLIEPFRSIYGRLRLGFGGSKQKRSIIVTSSLQGEGKSTVASNLAASFAQHKCRTLIIDCDLRRSTLHEAFAVEVSGGLMPWYTNQEKADHTDWGKLSGQLGITEVAPSLYLLPSGGHSESPTEVLGDSAVSDLFERLKSEYDVLLFDTPPVGLFPDATILSMIAPDCVFVARQFAVSRSKLGFSLNMMKRARVNILGVIFNGVKDSSMAAGYGSAQASEYSQGYEKSDRRYREYYSKKS